jgi:hypothetical protein
VTHKRGAGLRFAELAHIGQAQIKLRRDREQVLLAPEVANDQCRVDPGAEGDRTNGRAVIAARGESLARRFEDGRFGGVGSCAPAASCASCPPV